MLYALMGLTDDQALLQKYILLLMLLVRSRSTSRFLNKMDIFRAQPTRKNLRPLKITVVTPETRQKGNKTDNENGLNIM